MAASRSAPRTDATASERGLLGGQHLLVRILDDDRQLAQIGVEVVLLHVAVKLQQVAHLLGFHAGLGLNDIHPILVDVDLFGQQVVADELAVEHHVHELGLRGPRQTSQLAQSIGHPVAEEALVAGIGQQTPALVLGHPHHRSLLLQFDVVGFLILRPRVVAAALDLQGACLPLNPALLRIEHITSFHPILFRNDRSPSVRHNGQHGVTGITLLRVLYGQRKIAELTVLGMQAEGNRLAEVIDCFLADLRRPVRRHLIGHRLKSDLQLRQIGLVVGDRCRQLYPVASATKSTSP